jgi:hypothetical protein
MHYVILVASQVRLYTQPLEVVLNPRVMQGIVSFASIPAAGGGEGVVTGVHTDRRIRRADSDGSDGTDGRVGGASGAAANVYVIRCFYETEFMLLEDCYGITMLCDVISAATELMVRVVHARGLLLEFTIVL